MPLVILADGGYFGRRQTRLQLLAKLREDIEFEGQQLQFGRHRFAQQGLKDATLFDHPPLFSFQTAFRQPLLAPHF